MNAQTQAGWLRQAAAVLVLPFIMTIVIPALLISQTQTFNPGWGLPFPANWLPMGIGLAVISSGFVLVALTVNLFRTVGQGTLAPWDPTQRLVVVGVYRYVRNPMISGVMGILLGEALLSGSPPVLVWMLIFTIINMIYIPLSEEPGLRQRFGADYDEYCRHVPRWLPRRTPWIPDKAQ